MSYIIDKSNGKTHVRLTDEDIQNIKTRATAAPRVELYTTFILEIWYAVVGNSVIFNTMDKVDVTAWAIPQEQWKDLAEWLSEHSDDDNRVHNAMDFINHAPSAY